MTIRAGSLRNRIQVLKPSSERDEFGADVGGNTVIGVYWCSAKQISNDLIGNEARQSQRVIEFGTRYNKILEIPDNSMFIEFKGRQYDIDSVINPLSLNERLIITATLRGE